MLLPQRRTVPLLNVSSGQTTDVIQKVVLNAVKKGYSPRDIQVLAPMYKGPAGIDRLNKTLQEALNGNPDGRRKEIVYGDTAFSRR